MESFSASLSLEDLNRLRAVVKRAHMKTFPTEHFTDYEADRMIDAMGPWAVSVVTVSCTHKAPAES